MSEHRAPGDAFFRVDGLTAGYGGSPVVKAVSLTVGRGEIVCIVGPNGAGKSTVLKALTGVLTPAEGATRLGGEEVTGLPSEVLAAKGLGYVPQVGDVFDTLSVAENLEMGGYLLSKEELPVRTGQILEKFSLLQTLYGRIASTLSGGERKLLAISRALMLEPRLLILDEPTANLSPEASKMILRELRSLAEFGTAILLVEQRVRDALEISDRACVLVAGEIALEGPAPKLLARDDLGEIFLGGGKSAAADPDGGDRLYSERA
ncbi:MAG: ABC transporter ATP-binding protein [Actinomycetota bacterium]